jgi:hypothetical protein
MRYGLMARQPIFGQFSIEGTMTEKKCPLWRDESVQFWAKFSLWLLALFGTAMAWFRLDLPAGMANLALKSAQATNEKLVAQLELATFEFDKSRREADSRKSLADARQAELQVSKNSKSVLTVKPAVEQSYAVKDIREIYVETRCENVGLINVNLDAIRIDVFEGKPSPAVKEILDRTMTMFQYRREIERASAESATPLPSPSQPVAKPPRAERPALPADDAPGAALGDPLSYRRELIAAWEKLEQQCPHGQLFAINEASPDIEWHAMQRVSRIVPVMTTLQPGQSASKRFSFLLTEYPEQHHRQWFRFVVTVNPNSPESSQRFDFIVSGLPLPAGGQGTVAYTTTQHHDVYMRWEPDSPLIGIPPSPPEVPKPIESEGKP